MHEGRNLRSVNRVSGGQALESRVSSKDSCPVWGGAVGKGPTRYLAGRLLHYGRANFDLLRKRVLYAT